MQSFASLVRPSAAIALLLSWIAAPASADDYGTTPYKVVPGPGYTAQCSVDAAEALRRINAARAAGQQCGWRRMRPAPPLRWDGALQSVAAGHSRDMARRNYFDHRSPEGRTMRDRVARSGSSYKFLGENLAGGDRRVGGAIQGWLESPAHCENLMDPQFSSVAVACAGRPGSQWGTYWTMMLGRR